MAIPAWVGINFRVALCLATMWGVLHSDGLGAAETTWESQKSALSRFGIDLSGTYIGEVLGNASGGARRGTIYAGRLDIGMDVDLDRVSGWTGATFRANVFQIHGGGLSRDYIGNLLLISGIEALPATRLYELWIEQSLFGGALMIKVGQQPADIEFIDSKFDDIFANSALGWPGITGVILPSGGPAPPLAVPGIRIKAQFAEQFTAYLAIFNGDAAPPGHEDSQIRNPYGLSFRVTDPPWIIGQLKYAFKLGPTGLPGALTTGAWYHLGVFDSMSRAIDGGSLAAPYGSSEPAYLRGNKGVFAVYGQLLAVSAFDPSKGIGLFTRMSVSPSDRNLVSFYVDGGIQATGFNKDRPNDRFGVAITYAQISDGARQLDRDMQTLAGVAAPIRDYEAIFELTYSAEVRPGIAIQPIFQYVMHPGGGAVDLNSATGASRIKDAAVFGVRSTINF